MAAPTIRNVATTIQNTDTATSILITKPTDTAEGDVMYALISLAASTGSPALTGWSELEIVTHDGGAARLLEKIAGASEPSDYTFTWTGGSRAVGGIVTVQGNDQTTPTAASPTPATGSGTTPDPPASGTVSLADYLALVFTCLEGKTRTFTPPSGYNEEWDHGNSGSGSQVAHESQSMASQGLTGITSEDPGTFLSSAGDGWAAFTLLVAAPPPPASAPDEEWASTLVEGGQPVRRRPEMVAY